MRNRFPHAAKPLPDGSVSMPKFTSHAIESTVHLVPTTSGCNTFRPVIGLLVLFLIAYLAGILLSRNEPLPGCEKLVSYALAAEHYQRYTVVFLGLLAAGLLLLTMVALTGLCAVGPGLLILLFGLRGAFLGGCTAIAAQGGAHMLVAYWLLTWLPELPMLLLSLCLSKNAFSTGRSLFQVVFVHCGALTPIRQVIPLLKQYIFTSIMMFPIAAISAVGIRLFAAVLL